VGDEAGNVGGECEEVLGDDDASDAAWVDMAVGEAMSWQVRIGDGVWVEVTQREAHCGGSRAMVPCRLTMSGSVHCLTKGELGENRGE
jgi:hypothetical protein